MNLALETLPNQEAFSFDNIVVIEDSNGNPIMPDSDLSSSFNTLFPDGDLLPTTSGSGSSAGSVSGSSAGSGSGSVPTAGTPSASPPTDTYKAPDT